MPRVDGAARVAKGQRGAAIDVPAQAGFLFQRPPPPCLLRRFQKMPLNPLPPPRLTAAVSPFRTPQTLVQDDPHALELVREHPRPAAIGARQRPRQPAL